MKRALAIAFSMLMLCSLLLGTMATVLASEEGYDITEVYGGGPVTLDAEWDETEWDPGVCWVEYMGVDARWAYKMDTNLGPYYMSWIIEFSDNTDDAEDVWQICLDGTGAGGTAPTSDCNKIEITGHETLTVYAGTGDDWEVMEGADVQWNETLATTSSFEPLDMDHYVIEIRADKGTLGAWGANPPPEGLRIAMYDASNETQGWVAWPPTEADVPDVWGLIATYDTSIPESLSFGVVALLSSVAVAAVFYSRRNTKKLPK